jgi:hypothetical protein
VPKVTLRKVGDFKALSYIPYRKPLKHRQTQAFSGCEARQKNFLVSAPSGSGGQQPSAFAFTPK